MQKSLVTLLGKAVKTAGKLRGGGSALPGLVVERIDPQFISRTISQLPQGVIVVSGTNGKTTTTKMVVELLESQGMRVFTNRTGSNFTRGVAAALLGDVNMKGELAADVAVLELDEAHAVHFVKVVQPRYSLLLNVMRDQLDRFGEIDTTASMLKAVAEATTEKVVINREDPRLLRVAKSLPASKAAYFGLDSSLVHLFPNDDTMRGGETSQHDLPDTVATLLAVDDKTARFTLGDKEAFATLKLEGVYNIFNAIAAVALTRVVLGATCDETKLVAALESVTPAFGRGESIVIDGQPIELVLVKNPGGFRLSLSSFSPDGWASMIAINDNYADGRDMSWLWDVEFASLKTSGVDHVSGIRAYDMALRLQYDEVKVRKVEPNLNHALKAFIADNPNAPKRIFCTYTAMLALRRELSKLTKVEVIS